MCAKLNFIVEIGKYLKALYYAIIKKNISYTNEKSKFMIKNR